MASLLSKLNPFTELKYSNPFSENFSERSFRVGVLSAGTMIMLAGGVLSMAAVPLQSIWWISVCGAVAFGGAMSIALGAIAFSGTRMLSSLNVKNPEKLTEPERKQIIRRINRHGGYGLIAGTAIAGAILIPDVAIAFHKAILKDKKATAPSPATLNLLHIRERTL